MFLSTSFMPCVYLIAIFILAGSKETFEAFTRHVEEQLTLYKSFVIVNLAELSGKEKAISDAYLSNVLDYNSPDVVYISFDFHEYWYSSLFNRSYSNALKLCQL